MRELRLARWLVSVPAAMFGAIPLVVDLSETHVLHPDWPPHARLHTLWLICTNAGIAGVAAHLLWSGGLEAGRVRLAALLGVCVIGGFWIAVLTRPLYGGALGDPGGVPQLGGIDTNAAVFGAQLLSLISALVLVARRERRPG